MLIVPEFCFGCLCSPYRKYSDVCRSCSVYSFFSDVLIWKPPCGFNSCAKILIIVLEAVGISSVLNTTDSLRPALERYQTLSQNQDSIKIVGHKPRLLSMHATANVAHQLTEGKGAPGGLKEPGLYNCSKWLCNSIIHSTSREIDNPAPSTAWYHSLNCLPLHASVMISLFCIIAALALREKFVGANKLRCLPGSWSSTT